MALTVFVDMGKSPHSTYSEFYRDWSAGCIIEIRKIVEIKEFCRTIYFMWLDYGWAVFASGSKIDE